MNLCRFDNSRLGLVEDDRVYDVTYALDVLPMFSWPFPQHDAVIGNLSRIIERIEASPRPAVSRPIADVYLGSPVGNPGKVVAAPVNYRAHIEEAEADPEIKANKAVLKIGDAGLFLKATSAIAGPSDGITVHFPDRRTDHEVELVVIIGKHCKDVPEADALDVVAGYCIGLDITVRGAEDRSFRKSLDSYAILGPWLTTSDAIPDPDDLRLELRVNGAKRQDSNTSQLIYGVRKLISWASHWYTLQPGDVLFTGTPEGVGPIVNGDVIDASIDGLGAIRVDVRAEDILGASTLLGVAKK
jgi:2,4-didehydro-3-deoxy-L-rhamnonate hydrolase